jgi:hypothetical protein
MVSEIAGFSSTDIPLQPATQTTNHPPCCTTALTEAYVTFPIFRRHGDLNIQGQKILEFPLP